MPSTVVKRFEYDPASGVLTVTYVSGNVYAYRDVPQQVYLDMEESDSKGTYLNHNIKQHYQYEKIS